MADRRITISIEGTANDNVRLSEFLSQLEAVRAALKQTERSISGVDESTVDYRIVDLRHSSPATVVLEARQKVYTQEIEQDATTIATTDVRPKKRRRRVRLNTDYSGATVQKFFHSLREIRTERKRPADTDLQTLEAYRNLGSTLDKSVSRVDIVNSNDSISIDHDFRSAMDEIIGPDELVAGSVIGMLEKVNLHNTLRFDVFPTIGPKQVTCYFIPQLRPKVIAALDRYVQVRGTLRYKKLDTFPYAINAEELDVLPPEEELPTLLDLKGVAPYATGDKTVMEFIESIRNESSW